MHVLLISEDTADHLLFQRSIQQLSVAHSFTACESISDAHTRLASSQRLPPNLIFIDFELSQKQRAELDQLLESNDELRAVPLIVIAQCSAQEEIEAAYRLLAPCFLAFPEQVELRQQKIHACLEFWSNCAARPEGRLTYEGEQPDPPSMLFARAR